MSETRDARWHEDEAAYLLEGVDPHDFHDIQTVMVRVSMAQAHASLALSLHWRETSDAQSGRTS
jgi:hypothetical protein